MPVRPRPSAGEHHDDVDDPVVMLLVLTVSWTVVDKPDYFFATAHNVLGQMKPCHDRCSFGLLSFRDRESDSDLDRNLIYSYFQRH